MDCPSCGMPEGNCYNICPNSPMFYSPEQERADEAHYGDDDIRERYAGEVLDAELWAEGEADYSHPFPEWVEDEPPNSEYMIEEGAFLPGLFQRTDNEDIPF